MNPVLSFLVDGRPTALPSVLVPEMSLSSARDRMARHAFALTLDAHAVAHLAEPAYLAWVEASRRDDALCGGPRDGLARAGYPGIGEALQSPELAALVLGHYLLREVLGGLAWNGTVPAQYWLDEVTHCEIAGDRLSLFGRCYSKAPGQPQA